MLLYELDYFFYGFLAFPLAYFVLRIMDFVLERLIHHPTRYSGNQYGNITLRTTDGDDVPVLVVEPERPLEPKKCIVYSHGNKGNLISSIEYWRRCADELGAHVVLYDYVGYGISNKKYPSEKRCYKSMERVMNYVIDELEFDPKHILLVGKSLGTGIVVHYISSRPWTSPVVLISPYKSIFKTILNLKMRIFFDRFETYRKIDRIRCPIKIFHGDKDKVINISHGRELFESLPIKILEPSWLPGIGHADIMGAIEPEHFGEVMEITGWMN